MRRLPIYFLVDVSESMVGEPIEQVQEGMRNIIQELRMDPYSLETVFVSVIAFAGKVKILSPLTELYKFYPLTFPIGGGTSLGAAMNYLMDDMDKSIVKTTLEAKGDWKPIIFLFTVGAPTDNLTPSFHRWNANYCKHCNLVAISIGDNVFCVGEDCHARCPWCGIEGIISATEGDGLDVNRTYNRIER